jgi:histidinol phosphatase-like PHP family hydrolase
MYIYQMDFHYHAGQERNEKSLKEHLEHARRTGRKILGLTDHYGLYLPTYNGSKQEIYTRSMEGLKQYADELDSLRDEYSDITLLFAPEIGSSADLKQIPAEMHAVSDYYICETNGIKESTIENTQQFLDRVKEVADFSAACNKPAYIAHPFRSSINKRLVTNPIETKTMNMQPKDPSDYTEKEINDFFLMDVRTIGHEVTQLGIPLEINGESQRRIRITNLPAALNTYRAAYLILKQEGVSFVPGSDQHDFSTGRHGSFVPWDCFEFLGLGAQDIDFFKKIRA